MKKTVITLIFAIVIVFGFIFGSNLEIPYKYTAYIAVAILAFLDSLFGGIVSNMKNEFNMTVFVSGFFVNASTRTVCHFHSLHVTLSTHQQ